MKFISILILCSALTFAQGLPKKAHVAKLGDSYARVALLALKTIEADGSQPEFGEGDIYGHRHTLAKIHAADAEATTAFERNVTDVLNKLYSEKLSNNSKRDLQETMHFASLQFDCTADQWH